MNEQKVAGVVAEYNPFHSGHAWMIEELRGRGYGTVVCAISGPLVQRAEAALLPTHLRAEAALAAGADLVLRLPAVYAAASAERFGQGGAGVLGALGCVDTLAFGAEDADTALLQEVAALLQTEAFRQALKTELAAGGGFAAARAAAAERLLPGAGAVLRRPNNILAIEYCKALGHTLPHAFAAEAGGAFRLPQPLALPRQGAAHDGEPHGEFASASWLRAEAEAHGMEHLAPWVPAACMALYRQAEEHGSVIDRARWETALLSRLKGKTTAQFGTAADVAEGLSARLAAAVGRATTLDELYTLAKTKRFAHSRVRRLALATALALPRDMPAVPPFVQVLAANPRGLALLRRAKGSALRSVGTSLAKLAKAGEGATALVRAEALAEDLYALCQRRPAPGGGAFTWPALFVRE